jgi:alanine dehydrogenase
MRNRDFRISIIADISCDINGPIPSTIRATTISDPFYSYNPLLEVEEPAFSKLSNITVMSIDNLPGELPRDASLDFGRQLMTSVMHDLLSEIESPMIERASILKTGKLTRQYGYLNEYLNS